MSGGRLPKRIMSGKLEDGMEFTHFAKRMTWEGERVDRPIAYRATSGRLALRSRGLD